jgi:hypothetical protein
LNCGIAAPTTFRLTELLVIEPDVAEMFAVPGAATPVARPFLPAELLIVAALLLSDFQVTEPVTGWLVLSSKCPVAVNCSVVPCTMEVLSGATVIDTSFAGTVTVRFVEPVTELCVAEIIDCPAATPVARPAELTVAAAAFDELQVAVLVRSCVLPSLKVPVALNCTGGAPTATLGFLGVTAIELSVGVGGLVVPPPEPPEHPASRIGTIRSDKTAYIWTHHLFIETSPPVSPEMGAIVLPLLSDSGSANLRRCSYKVTRKPNPMNLAVPWVTFFVAIGGSTLVNGDVYPWCAKICCYS